MESIKFPFVRPFNSRLYLPSYLNCKMCICSCRLCDKLVDLNDQDLICCFICEKFACEDCSDTFIATDWKESVEKFKLVNDKEYYDDLRIICCLECYASEDKLENDKEKLMVLKKKVKKFNRGDFLNSINEKIAGNESEFIHRRKRIVLPGDSWWSDSEDETEVVTEVVTETESN